MGTILKIPVSHVNAYMNAQRVSTGRRLLIIGKQNDLLYESFPSHPVLVQWAHE